ESRARSSWRPGPLSLGGLVHPSHDTAVTHNGAYGEAGEQLLCVPSFPRRAVDRLCVQPMAVRELYEIGRVTPYRDRPLPADRSLADAESGEQAGCGPGSGRGWRDGTPERHRTTRSPASPGQCEDRPVSPRAPAGGGHGPERLPTSPTPAGGERSQVDAAPPFGERGPGPADGRVLERSRRVGVVPRDHGGPPGEVGSSRPEGPVRTGAQDLGKSDTGSTSQPG